MFQMTPPYPQWVRQWLTGVVFGALAVWTVAFVVARTTVWLPAIWLEWLAGGVLVCVYGGYALLTLYLQWRRKKRDFNITLWFWQLGMVSAVIGLGGLFMGELMAGAGFSPRYTLALIMLILVGSGISLVNGMLYKIIPFLVWLHLTITAQESRVSRSNVPQVKNIIPVGETKLQFTLHLISVLLLVGACMWPAALTRLAGLAFAASGLLLWWNLWLGIRKYRQVQLQLVELSSSKQHPVG
ncbi:MAG: hypothetical protein GY731_05390 [Gammaproteobacteria bacterium]|nr:hypothetical protein [Gammaproteobacteria bacterium]